MKDLAALEVEGLAFGHQEDWHAVAKHEFGLLRLSSDGGGIEVGVNTCVESFLSERFQIVRRGLDEKNVVADRVQREGGGAGGQSHARDKVAVWSGEFGEKEQGIFREIHSGAILEGNFSAAVGGGEGEACLDEFARLGLFPRLVQVVVIAVAAGEAHVALNKGETDLTFVAVIGGEGQWCRGEKQ